MCYHAFTMQVVATLHARCTAPVATLAALQMRWCHVTFIFTFHIAQ